MMKHNTFIKQLSWRESIAEIAAVNANLADIMQSVQHDSDYMAIKVRYPYGAKIVKHGQLQLPMKNGVLMPLSHAAITESIREKLTYRFQPLGLILDNTAEMYFSASTRIIPKKLYGTGEIFGLWPLFDSPYDKYLKHAWNMSAGARTIFMLPMISDNVAHARLRRELSIHSYPPKTLLDQHDIFTEIVKSTETDNPWSCDVLFFCRRWVEDMVNNNPRFIHLYNYLLKQAWQQSYHCRRTMALDIIQEAFLEATAKRNLKLKPYILSTFNHLLDIGRGVFPGFVAAGLSEQAAPIRLLQEAYVDHYLLKEYAPIVMHPAHFNVEQGSDKVYYSLSLPTLLNYAPRPGRMPSIMADLRELKLLFNLARDFYQDVGVDYALFHTELDQFSEIFHSQDLPQFDDNLLNYPAIYAKRCFPYASPFLRGCIQVASRKSL